MSTISHIAKEILQTSSTASIATCLLKRGLRNQYIQNVFPLKSYQQNMVGPAFTLRYIPAREDLNTLSVFEDRQHPQRVSIETCPKGHVLIMDSRKDARAASAGSILITRLMLRGAEGIVTDGGFRDCNDLMKLNFPIFQMQPSAATNLTHHQAIDINVPIACGDVAVFPNDLIVGDDDGVIVIPLHLMEDIAKQCQEMNRFEAFVMQKVMEGRPIIGLYPATEQAIIKEYESWKSMN